MENCFFAYSSLHFQLKYSDSVAYELRARNKYDVVTNRSDVVRDTPLCCPEAIFTVPLYFIAEKINSVFNNCPFSATDKSTVKIEKVF